MGDSTVNVITMDSYNEWKELIIEAKNLGMTKEFIKYNLILLKAKNNNKKESTK